MIYAMRGLAVVCVGIGVVAATKEEWAITYAMAALAILNFGLSDT